MTNNKTKNSSYLDMLFSSYLIIAGLLSLLIVFYVSFSLGLNSLISILWLLFSLFLISSSVINNYQIFKKNKLRKRYLINLLICIPQSIIIFSNGFHFKYTQGLELFLAYNTNFSKGDWMFFPINFTHEVVLNFLGSSFTLIGVNFISVILIGYYTYKLRRTHSNLRLYNSEEEGGF